MYHLTKEVIIELLDREIRKSRGIAHVLYREELIEIKENFLDCLDTYDIELKDIPLMREEDLI